MDRRGASLSPDEKEIYFGSTKGPFAGPLYTSTIHRAERGLVVEPFVDSGDWKAMKPLAGQDSPRFSEDGTTVVLAAITQSGGKPHLHFARRGDASADFGDLLPIALKVDGSQFELNPYLIMSRDGQGELFFSQCTSASTDNCDSPKEGANKELVQVHVNHPNLAAPDAFGDPKALAEINAEFNEYAPVVSADGLEIFFSRNGRIFRAWRKHQGAQFGQVNIVKDLDLPGHGEMAPTWLSPNNCRLYFQSQKGNTSQPRPIIVDLWVAERKPLSP
ncbi:hypothetical protein LZC95_07655 [Pendulispora brunnea]|uniref:Uncharacterized protein n=1 Tax=Pendulispora brunnea TaxID=2905690 RepID=A0ABZ2KF81_9BACT